MTALADVPIDFPPGLEALLLGSGQRRGGTRRPVLARPLDSGEHVRGAGLQIAWRRRKRRERCRLAAQNQPSAAGRAASSTALLPLFKVHDRWLIRPLASDIAKIDMPKPQDKRLALAPALLHLMGRETANIQIGSRTTKDLVARVDALEHTSAAGFQRQPIGSSKAVARTTGNAPRATASDVPSC